MQTSRIEHVYKFGERGSGTKVRGNVQDYEQIRKFCLSKGVLFQDQIFPADASSLGQWGHQQWKRPFDITRNPYFILDGTSRFDINQGELGDCWLISAIANITLHQNIVNNIMDKNQTFNEGDYAGIFHFRFWQLGKWVDVVIDDYLPVKYDRPMFLHSVGNNEFWGSLLEKAYAKLNGSYQALVGGFTYEALEDFTGGLTEVLKLSEHNASNLFQTMKKAFDRSSLMGCSIEGTGNIMEGRTAFGLITTHAYSVTNVKEVTLTNGESVQLIRLRNPWGNEAEWKGAWSDGSKEWRSISQAEREKIGLTFDNDGEFWMSVQDFKGHFSSLDMTHLGPEAFRKAEDGRRRWEVNEFHGQWVRGVSAGGCNVTASIYSQNPQYLITVEDPDPEDNNDSTMNTVIVSLMQKSRRSLGQGVTNLCIGFSIYKVKNPEHQSKPLDSQFFLYNQAVSTPTYSYQRAVTHRFLLPPGTYCIVPSTYQPYVEGEYLLRVFSEKYNEMKEHDEEFGEEEAQEMEENKDVKEINDEAEETIKSAFEGISGDDNEVDWKELKELLDNAFPEETKNRGISKNNCRSMVALMDGDKTGTLGYEEFKQLLFNIKKWWEIFEKYDKDGSGKLDVNELKDALSAAGFRLNKRLLYMVVYRYADRKRQMSFDDFLACAVKLKGMIAIFKEKDRENKNYATFNLEEWMEVTMYS